MIPCPRCRARVSPKALRAHLLFHAEAEARALLKANARPRPPRRKP